jgi:hypothetical protein
MLQTASPKTGGGACSPEGRTRQIAARVSNGVHFQSPVLPDSIESQDAWNGHLASLEEALQPVGAWEKLCVYRIALSAWKHFRLVRHEVVLVTKAVTHPDNGFTSSYDEDFISPDVIAEVLRRSESSLAEELFQMRDFMLRVSALAGTDLSDIAFTGLERREILTAAIQQSRDDQDDEEASEDMDDAGEPTGQDGADNEDAVIIPAVQLRDEIEQIATAKGLDVRASIEVLAEGLASGLRQRQRRLELARTHIGACLIPDERNVNRLGAYERGLDAASRRYLNDLYRAQALRLGQPVVAPIAVDVNVSGEQGNGLH